MIVSISLITDKKSSPLDFNEVGKNKTVIDLPKSITDGLESFDVEITFKNPIIQFRNHDYTWVKINKNRIATEYSPKIIQLENGYFVQPNQSAGIWEVKKENPKVISWRFNPECASPLTVYSGSNAEKIINAANTKLNFPKQLELLFSKENAIEFSRSEIPFAAIACFTDHCDFDTAENVKLQREFFKTNNIKVTKGFFLKHFSKRKNNASFENEAAEFNKWREDGHELAYHSLTQSLKPKEESLTDFMGFTPPFKDVATWIDHGYQPYNFSLYQNTGIKESAFSENLKDKNISILWNYTDSGTSSVGVINQLNTDDFTLASFYKGIKSLPFKDRMGVLIKNIMFHYYADEKLIVRYKSTAGHFKALFLDKKPQAFFKLMANFITLSVPLGKILLFWRHHKNIPYKLARYSPLVFKHNMAGNDFYIFQTLEMIDFKKSLSADNIEKLINESGVFIAHTYFSVPMDYHTGRMFRNPIEIDTVVAKNFAQLGTKITNGQIWNPTLKEFVLFLANFEKTILDVDAEGKIVVTNASGLPYRNAQ
ncbi:MAG: hypothetical protein M0D53_02820 [Flavobacterium sp. JAD_PAG50586_2]|nr:MAG: hypothetical protein M0D53_02820 [Flavobacterium sp. JAD_PAG50586_2]